MDDVMVTGRMSREKKLAGNAVLSREGLSASQAINRMYERLAEDQSAGFLDSASEGHSRAEWLSAAHYVDSISSIDRRRATKFDDMSRAEIKASRLHDRGLL